MVDSKENYKFDLAVKGLNSDGDDWSMGSCLRAAALIPPRCYLASVSPLGGGGGTAKLSYRR